MNATVSLNLFQTGVLLFAFIGAVRLVGVDRRTTRVVFFAFAMACALLSNLYWLAYDILRPETRMPFAANEIGEWALFLLMGASLGADPVPGALHIEAVCAALFSAASAALWALFMVCNTALWIAWSGEWVQDILTGAAYGYFICRLLVRIRREGVFSGWEWVVLAAVCPVLIAAQAAIFFVPLALKRPLDLFCYALLFAVANSCCIEKHKPKNRIHQGHSQKLESIGKSGGVLYEYRAEIGTYNKGDNKESRENQVRSIFILFHYSSLRKYYLSIATRQSQFFSSNCSIT